jgi:hypothetical protein
VLNRASALGHETGMAEDLGTARAYEASILPEKGVVRVEQNGLVDSSAMPLAER